VSILRHELGFYIPEDGIHLSRRCEHLKSCNVARTSDPILAAVCFVLEHKLLGDRLMSAINRFNITINVRTGRRLQTMHYNDLPWILNGCFLPCDSL
jgi:hypothetical protein